jgi:hypothetical protein
MLATRAISAEPFGARPSTSAAKPKTMALLPGLAISFAIRSFGACAPAEDEASQFSAAGCDPVFRDQNSSLPFRPASELASSQFGRARRICHLLHRHTPSFARFRSSLLFFCVFGVLSSTAARAQGGPPYYTNDPGTPGNRNWEINLGYMPFLYTDQSTSHVPDVDINFGLGDRIQLTYESAWLRVRDPSPAPAKYGMAQDQLGVKWRFYDHGDAGSAISVFPQLSVNNPNHSAARGITPPGASLILPIEFTRKFGPIDVNAEAGYNFVHVGPDGWLAGLVAGHEFTKRFEMDAEFYATGTFHPSYTQPTFDVGARYRMHRPLILLLMAGRSFEPARSNQPYFVGYFGIQILLPPKSFDKE